MDALMSRASGTVTFALMLAGAGLYFAPEQASARIRTVVADMLRPGQLATRQLASVAQAQFSQLASRSTQLREREFEKLEQQLHEEQERTAALQLQLAQSSDQQQLSESVPDPLRSLPPLATTSLVDARVLGDSLTEKWRKGKLLDRGQTNGIRESELVLKSTRPLVDVGHDGNLSPEDALLLGRCVIGKIERVGRWTSTFLLLTDTEYRGRAQLVHQTDTGYVFGAKGILEGRGKSLCQLTGIESSDSVAVGDAVYTATRDGQTQTPLYYGRVVEATLNPSDSEWKILVEPVPVPNDFTTVQVLRTTINADRLASR
jgi:cell shape-determining protein MreC